VARLGNGSTGNRARLGLIVTAESGQGRRRRQIIGSVRSADIEGPRIPQHARHASDEPGRRPDRHRSPETIQTRRRIAQRRQPAPQRHSNPANAGHSPAHRPGGLTLTPSNGPLSDPWHQDEPRRRDVSGSRWDAAARSPACAGRQPRERQRTTADIHPPRCGRRATRSEGPRAAAAWNRRPAD
jgi:hypothetical protein